MNGINHREHGKARRFALWTALILAAIGGCIGERERPRMNWEALWEKYELVGYDGLEEPEQVWLNARSFMDSTNNGGLVSYFYNSGADRYDDTVFALGELQAHEALDIFEMFGGLFGEDVPADINERNEIIDSWASGSRESEACENVNESLYPLFEELEAKLYTYLIEHELDPDYGE